jgi:membrane protease YdiL (CAAX protease family)
MNMIIKTIEKQVVMKQDQIEKHATTPKRTLVVFVSLTYLVFWCLLGLTGVLISLNAPSYVQTIVKNVCAWAPTIVVLIMFRRLFPGVSFGEFFRRNFTGRVNPLTFLLLLVLQVAIVALAVVAQLWATAKGLDSVLLLSPSALLTTFVVTATDGSTGEELGWRGYLLKELQKRHTLFTAGLLVGIVWGFWHLPLWIISGYSGISLVLFIAYFLVSIVSTSLVITVFYSRQWNLLIPIWIHFLFNFVTRLVKIDILPLLGWISLGYAVFAFIMIMIERKRMFDRQNRYVEDKASNHAEAA